MVVAIELVSREKYEESRVFLHHRNISYTTRLRQDGSFRCEEGLNTYLALGFK